MATISNSFTSTSSLVSSLSNFDPSVSTLSTFSTVFNYSWTYKLNSKKTQITGTDSAGDSFILSGKFSSYPYSMSSLTFSGSDGSALSIGAALSYSKSGNLTGYLSSFNYSDSSTSFKVTGKFYPSGESTSTLSYVEYQTSSYKFSFGGTFKYDSSLGLTSASLTSFSYTDGTNAISISGLSSVNVLSIFNSGTDLTESNIETLLSSADSLTGGSGANYLSGYAGNDTLSGLAGADTLLGGLGNDKLIGGDGIDTFTVTAGTDTITDLGTGGADILTVSSGSTVNATICLAWTATSSSLNSGTTNITTSGMAVNLSAITSDNGFTVTDTGGATTLIGSYANDTLVGGTGADTLLGGLGNDSLSGSAGNDVLTGGSGSDIFSFNTKLNSSSNIDTVTDFTSGTDKIYLSKSIFAAISSTGTLSSSAFYSVAGAVKGHDSDDRIIYDTSSGKLYYDSDGSGKVAAIQFGTLTAHPDLLNTDIVVYG